MTADAQSSLSILFDQSGYSPVKRKFECVECVDTLRYSKPKFLCTTCGVEFLDKRDMWRRNTCQSCLRMSARRHEEKRKRGEERAQLRKIKREKERSLRPVKVRPIKEEPKKIKRFCQNCGVELSGIKRKFCSVECARSVRSDAIQRELLKSRGLECWPTRRCDECDEEFVARPYGARDRRFCRRECGRRWTLREKTRQRRAITKTLAVVDFSADDVFDRDQWTCQECGIATPRSMRATGAENEPQLDHIIPLSRGGDHAPSNCRCLCRKCNLDKGAMMDKEWRKKKRQRLRDAA